jgi:exonuclease SbcC
MKILQIRFQNLNSLFGEWEIDLTNSKYTTEGVFAITGPTGAGKSTILDAICLAIYGRTPRLDSITNKSNEIMSQNTAVCFAEVVFETQKGTYRCHWSQNRARGGPEGELQQPKHEISDVSTKEILASQLTKTKNEVERLTGMDYGRFTQSMLLAQGGFDEFLKADPKNRAPILEQITGTQIYSDLSMHAFDRQREELRILDGLKESTSGIILLSVVEEAQIMSDLELNKQDEGRLQSILATLNSAILWLETISKLTNELEGLKISQELLTKEAEEFSEDRRKWEGAVQAHNLEGEYEKLSSKRSQQTKDTNELNATKEQLPLMDQEILSAADKQSVKRDELKGSGEALFLKGKSLHRSAALIPA